MIHVCSLRLLAEEVARLGASHVVTLINEDTMPTTPRIILPENHLQLGMNDISEPVEGLTPPDENHIENLLAFVSNWDQSAPMVIHCWAGISRSTAAGYVALCLINPDIDEHHIAVSLRKASHTATPNRRIVAIADRLLARDGRMVAAIETIGSGSMVGEGIPFSMPAKF
ncbi:MAG: tyrosine protein phosphatase [Rhizobiales bacterium]|nr:tyrosine protein phosphatase [Hyphomicrobiales bacterium]